MTEQTSPADYHSSECPRDSRVMTSLRLPETLNNNTLTSAFMSGGEPTQSADLHVANVFEADSGGFR